jgi:hypothetical protein
MGLKAAVKTNGHAENIRRLAAGDPFQEDGRASQVRGRKMTRILTCFVLLSLAACNTNQVLDPKEDRLSSRQLNELLVGNVIVLEQGAQMSYAADGRYQWINTTEHDLGKYTIENNQVCVKFDDGNARCDHYKRSDNGYVVVDRNNQTGVVSRIEKITTEES